MASRRFRRWSICALVLASPASGCGESRAPPPLCSGAPCPVERTLNDVFQSAIAARAEILLVVDDTPSAKALENNLPAAYARLARFLTTFPGGPLEVRLAVVPASGGAGTMTCAPAPSRATTCGLPTSEPVLANGRCGADPNTTSSLEDAVSCLGALGSDACGAFEPFAAIRRALGGEPGVPGLRGFEHPEWPLLVAVFAGSDDASVRDGAQVPVTELVSFLKGLRPDPFDVMVSIVGPVAGCGVTDGVAPRLKELADAFGRQGVYESACRTNLSFPAPLSSELGGYDVGAGLSPCFPPIQDIDPGTPGLQADCVVEEASVPVDAPPAELALVPSCDRGPPPCWRVTWARPGLFCPKGWASFVIDRGPGWCSHGSTTTHISCLGCAQAGDPACLAPP